MTRSPCFRFTAALILFGCADAGSDSELSFEARTAVLSEELRIDGHAENLVPIGAVAVREDGVIAVLQSQDDAVRFFDAAGRLLGAFGRSGEGPGEFANPVRLGWLADTLWIDDGMLRRMTIVSPTLELARTFSTPMTARTAPEDAGLLPDLTRVFTQALDRDGSLYVALTLAEGEPAIGRVNVDGLLRRLLVRLPAEEMGIASFPGGSIRLPFENPALSAIAPDGSRVAAVKASVEGPDAGTFDVTVVLAEGDTVFAGQYPFAAEAVSREEGERQIEARAAMVRSSSAPPEFVANAVAALHREARVPAIHPPFTGLLIGGDGAIWIELRQREDGARSYYVLTPAGEPLGMLSIPEGSRIRAAAAEQIWVTEPDTVGVESVVRYSVRW